MQKIKLNLKLPVFTKKGSKNQLLLEKLVDKCLSIRDYKVVLKLLVYGEYIKTSDDGDLTDVAHRIGKVLNITLENE